MPDLPSRQPGANQPLPGKGLLGWLGRQVGHVAKAVKTDVTASKVVYRNDKVEEAPHPADPSLKLRRTVIDEVIVEKKPRKDADDSVGNA